MQDQICTEPHSCVALGTKFRSGKVSLEETKIILIDKYIIWNPKLHISSSGIFDLLDCGIVPETPIYIPIDPLITIKYYIGCV